MAEENRSTDRWLAFARNRTVVLCRPSDEDQLPLWQAIAQTVGVKIRPAELDAMQMRAMFETKRDVEALEEQIRDAYRGVVAGKTSDESFSRFRDEKIAEATKKLERLQRRLGRSSVETSPPGQELPARIRELVNRSNSPEAAAQ